MNKATLEHLIFTRINKWGQASDLINFSDDPIWKLNPQGAIAVYFHSLGAKYWDSRKDYYELVCEVDGAWDAIKCSPNKGGIGGRITNNKGKIVYIFSGPVTVDSSLEAEIEAITHMFHIIKKPSLEGKSTVICSDSALALKAFRVGNSKLVKQEILDYALSRMDQNVTLNFVPRDLNENADSLAKSGLRRDSFSHFWANLE